uniref:Uncharacterized protein n=1 Tax=Anopheles atroparvus TaxID=41427 RepID=A0AAG5DCS1_ANOAO
MKKTGGLGTLWLRRGNVIWGRYIVWHLS